MPIAPKWTFKIARLDPALEPDHAAELAVNLKPSTSYLAGTVLGEMIGTDEVSQVVIDATGGVWVFTWSGESTPNVAWNISAADLEHEIELLPNVGAGNVRVTMPAPLTYRIAWIAALGSANQPAPTTTATGLTGGAGTAVVSTPVAGVAGSRGVYAPYSNAAADGSQVAKGLCRYQCVTDAAGNITLGEGPAGTSEHGHTTRSIDMFYRGVFWTSQLTGLDASAITDLGVLIDGTIEHGRIRIG
jgi:hypothetical protein